VPRSVVLPFGVALLSAVVVAAIVVNTNRQAVLLSLPSATGSSTVEPLVLTSGEAIVSRKPDLAILAAGLESQQATASAALD